MINPDSTGIVNERVALRRGINRHKMSDGSWSWRTGYYLYGRYPPNFCGNWEHAGPLLVELFDKEPQIALDDILIIQEELKCDLTEATTRAWDAWKEQSK